MKIYEIVFSPTGGTKKAADILTDAFGADSMEVDLTRADFTGYTLEEDSLAVIAVPSFGGRVPGIAIDRLKMLRGNGAKAVIVAVYGNRAQEDTLIEAADAAKESGFTVVAGIAAVAEHSIAHQYASGRPDAEDQAQLEDFARQILHKLGIAPCPEPSIPGNRPYKKAGAGLVPRASADCVNCGLCASKCPVGAIDKSNPRRTDKTVCINCMRCISVCPRKARTVSPVMVKAVGMALKKACSVKKENELFL